VNKLILTTIASAAILLQGCGARVTSYAPNPEMYLSHHYKKIAIIANGANVQSITTSNLFEGQLSQTQIMDGGSQVQMAAESIGFECEKLGFHVVSINDCPDLLLEFSIGSIRFDSLAGWIADQAIVRLRDAKSKQIVAQFQAKSRFITPTVENIISNLVTEIKKNCKP
jgi:hypothetical protein